MALNESSATLVAELFSLGGAAVLRGPAARGQLGQVWQLQTDAGTFAIKEWFAEPDPEQIAAAADFGDRLQAAGVQTPGVVRTRSGEATAAVAGTLVRAFEWVDLLPPTRRLDPEAVGRLLATMHRAGRPTTDPVDRWFSSGVGPEVWTDLLDRLTREDSPFAGALGSLVGELIAVEAVIEPPARTIECHRDLWADNLLRRTDGELCVLDVESVGPADPSLELGMALFEFGLDDPGLARRIHTAYVEAGGPGRVTRRGHFSMLVAVQAHLGQLACSRWIGSEDPIERKRLETSVREILDDPVTVPRIDRILASLSP